MILLKLTSKQFIMKKLLLTIFTLLLISSNLWSQGSVTATYSLGDIPTDRSFTSIGSTSSCPGLLDVVIPAGEVVTSVDVSYDMTATTEWMSEQRSWLYCSTTTTGEPVVFSGVGNIGGTYSYSRSGLTIADGAQGTISFEMHAGRSYGGSGCSTIQNQVDDGTWTITVNHAPYIQSVTSTYSLGDIPTDRSFTSIGSTSSCPGLLDVVIPAGRIVSSVDVSYDMTAGSEWMSEQRSWLYCSTTTTGEAAVYSGAGNTGGTYNYSRSGLTIADGAQGTISFEMHAGRSYGGSGCSTIQNQVDDGTWTITVNHIPTPSCADASATMSNITATGATATWAAANGAASYDWEVVPTGNAQGVGVVASGSGETGLTVSITGLTSSTGYDFLISSDCTTDYASAVTFNTSYINDACGGAIDLDTLTSPISATTAGATNDYTGGDCLTNTASPDLFYRVTVPAEYTLTIQQTSNAYDSKVRLAYGTSCPGDIVIACQDDPDTGVLSWVNDTGSDWEVYYVQSAYSTGSGAFVLDWSVEAPALDPPGCAINLLPADGAIDQSSSVGISWDQAADGVPVTSYDLYLSNGTTTDLALLAADWTSTAATLNNLNFGSTYYWQIIPKNDLGEAVGCVVNSFTVKSLPTGSSGVTCGTGDQEGSPFSESFDAQGDWTGDFGSSNDDWKFGTGPTGSSDTGPSGPQDAGGSYIYWEASGSNTNSGAIVSPLIDLTAIEPGNDAELTFYMHAYGAGMGTLEVGASNSQAGPFTNIFTWDGAIQTASGDDWTQVGLDLSSYTGGNLYLEFKNTGIADYRGDMSIDTLTVTVCEEVPSCNYVSNISESNIDETSTTISFTDSNDPTPSNGWDYELLDITAGEVTGGGTLGNFTSTSNILSGLTGAGNDYEIIITTNCGGVFTDITSTPESFTWTQGILPGTACDSPIIAVAGTYSDVTVFDNAFNNTNSGADGAIWYSFTPTEDGTIDVSSCASDPTGVDTRLWLYTDGCTTLTAVDSDDDGCDSPITNTYGSVVTGVAVSSGQEYLIEWDNRWDSDEFDWTLTFTPLPDCADATNITQVQPTTTSATISWSDSVNPTVDGGYDYELLDITAGQVAGEGITGNSTTFSLELTGLIGSHNEYTINLTTVCNAFSNSPGTSFSWVQDPVLGYDCSAPITVLEGVNSAVFSAEGAGNIWYEFDAPADYGGTLSISACITGTDTYLQMWDDCDSFNSGSDDYCSLGSGLIDVPVARSQSYKFQWLNIYSSANFDFEFVFTPTPGSVCTAAIEAQVGTNTTNFTTSAGEVTIGGATDEVVHFSYTPVSDGVMTISSCDATSDTIFYIADGCGNYIANSDDDCGLQSTLTLSVTASQELKIYWAGWYSQATFDWTLEYAASGSWTGATSTDWSESSNWATGVLPSSSNDITIGTGLTNYPIIGSSTDANINNITVSSGASLIIDETSSLTVSGDFTNNGTVTLNSTADDFSSLIVTGTATGDITYNRYVNVYDDTAGGGWDLVCSPVDMSIADFIAANNTTTQSTALSSTAGSSTTGFSGGWQLLDFSPSEDGATIDTVSLFLRYSGDAGGSIDLYVDLYELDAAVHGPANTNASPGNIPELNTGTPIETSASVSINSTTIVQTDFSFSSTIDSSKYYYVWIKGSAASGSNANIQFDFGVGDNEGGAGNNFGRLNHIVDVTATGSNIQVLGDDYAFAQFNNATGQWERYATDTDTGSFTAGQGYAMATTTGATVALLVLCKQQIKASILSITMV